MSVCITFMGYAAYSVKLGGDVTAFNEFYQLAPRRLIIVYEQKLLACCVVIPSAAALVARVVGAAAPFSDGNVKRRGLAIIFYLYRGVGKRKLGVGGVGIVYVAAAIYGAFRSVLVVGHCQLTAV